MSSHGNSTFGATTLFHLPITRPAGNKTFGAIRGPVASKQDLPTPKNVTTLCALLGRTSLVLDNPRIEFSQRSKIIYYGSKNSIKASRVNQQARFSHCGRR